MIGTRHEGTNLRNWDSLRFPYARLKPMKTVGFDLGLT